MEFVQDLAGASQSFGESSVKIRKIDTFVILEETRHILNMKPVEGQNSSPAELTHTSATPALEEMNTGTGVFAVLKRPLGRGPRDYHQPLFKLCVPASA
jgi:hypothetical protein